jgi:hypothetical protein
MKEEETTTTRFMINVKFRLDIEQGSIVVVL